MRETLYEHGSKLVMIRQGFDAHVRYEWPNDFEQDPIDLTGRFPELLQLGWKAPPLPPVTLRGPDGERTSLGVMSIDLGEDGAVTVFPGLDRSGLRGPSVGEPMTCSEAADIALRGLRVVFAQFAAEPGTDVGGESSDESNDDTNDTTDAAETGSDATDSEPTNDA